MAMTWSSDFIYVIAMLKTTPLVVTIGLSLTIPVAIVGDFILKQPVAPLAITGAVLVLAAFVLIGFEDSKPQFGVLGKQPDETSSLSLVDTVEEGT